MLMKFLQNLKLSIKIPAIIVIVLGTGLMLMGQIGGRMTEVMLKEEGTERLVLVRQARKRALDSWTETVMSDLASSAISDQSSRMFNEFGSAWTALGDDPSTYLVQKYITDNPNPLGSRQALGYARDMTNYSKLHRRYHRGFLAQLEEKGYYDIFLIDLAGNIIYTVMKEDDFAQNVTRGPLAQSGLADVFNDVTARDTTDPFVSKFAHYGPSSDAPAAFAGVGVRSPSGALLGVLAYQISMKGITSVMAARDGLGETGQAYLVDSEGMLASDLNGLEGATTLDHQISIPPVTAALAGEIGVFEGVGALGEAAIIAYAPVDLFGLNKALIVEQSEAELLAPIRAQAHFLELVSAALMLALCAASVVIARSVAKPLQQVERAMAEIAQENYETVVPFTQRTEEVGQIARTLQAFSTKLAQGDALARDATLKGAAFAAGSSAMMMADTAFKITYTNAAMTALIAAREASFRQTYPELDPGSVIGQPLTIFHESSGWVQRLMDDQATLPMTVHVAVGDGRYTLDLAEVVMRDTGRIGYVLEWRDVTETQMNTAILSSLQANQIVLEMTPQGLVTAANQNGLDAMGVSAETLLGRNIQDLLSSEARTGTELWSILAQNKPVTGRLTLRGESVSPVELQGALTPVSDRNGAPLKTVLIASDVTQAQEEIVRSEADRARMQAEQQHVVEALRVNLRKLSDGDLSSRIDDAFSSEYEQLRADFNAATTNLRAAMLTVIENSIAIETEALEISGAAEDLSRRTETQAATLEETAAALDQLTSSVTSSSQGAHDANRVVLEARQKATSSGIVVQQAVDAMGEIESSSSQISKIISVIDDIAFQTNLLALNAGVEAARAGEAGRGFAVVASEVRALAQRSSEAAREIDRLISASTDHVQRGVGLVGEAGTALDGILASVIDIAGRVSEIATSAQEQSAGLAEINTAVNALDQVTQQNAAMFEQTTAASHSLKRGALVLSDTVAKFKTGGEDAPQPRGARATPRKPDAPDVSDNPAKSARDGWYDKGDTPDAPPRTSPAKRSVNGGLTDGADWEDF